MTQFHVTIEMTKIRCFRDFYGRGVKQSPTCYITSTRGSGKLHEECALTLEEE